MPVVASLFHRTSAPHPSMHTAHYGPPSPWRLVSPAITPSHCEAFAHASAPAGGSPRGRSSTCEAAGPPPRSHPPMVFSPGGLGAAVKTIPFCAPIQVRPPGSTNRHTDSALPAQPLLLTPASGRGYATNSGRWQGACGFDLPRARSLSTGGTAAAGPLCIFRSQPDLQKADSYRVSETVRYASAGACSFGVVPCLCVWVDLVLRDSRCPCRDTGVVFPRQAAVYPAALQQQQ